LIKAGLGGLITISGLIFFSQSSGPNFYLIEIREIMNRDVFQVIMQVKQALVFFYPARCRHGQRRLHDQLSVDPIRRKSFLYTDTLYVWVSGKHGNSPSVWISNHIPTTPFFPLVN
jgi:hypothetical protein